ncbi:MAG TPA: hypothetical protein VG406_11425 [Isosphaeraceae bacterium]|jgi:hypothetical protein|nr:hypothetical protein [Isosphaeraceae bacterium]
MPRDVARAELYRGTINLWVEDDLTREYLSGLWGDASVAFFIAGGNEGVRSVVNDAEAAGFRNVFGLVDRDFGLPRKAEWMSETKTFRTFVLPAHEIENYLLDAEALQASRSNNLGRTRDQIEGYMAERANGLVWWAACRDVVAEVKHRFRDDLIRDPPCDIDEPRALAHIIESPWFKKLGDEIGKTSAADVHSLLSEAHANARGRITDGDWRWEFAGKEIFRDVESRICNRTRHKPGSSTKEALIDLAKDVAQWQSSNQRVHQDLVDLLNALKIRIARMTAGP